MAKKPEIIKTYPGVVVGFVIRYSFFQRRHFPYVEVCLPVHGNVRVYKYDPNNIPTAGTVVRLKRRPRWKRFLFGNGLWEFAEGDRLYV